VRWTVRPPSMAAFRSPKLEAEIRRGRERAEINITDANLLAMLKMPFAMAAMVNEDSTQGFKGRQAHRGSTRIVEWTEKSKHSKATILAGDRYIVDIDCVTPVSDSEAEQTRADESRWSGQLKPAVK